MPRPWSQPVTNSSIPPRPTANAAGDTFLSFAARMGLPGIAAGLTSFALMYWTNRHKVRCQS
tara:strand:+ start:376 stop:561 length:186 start_codon:yes stop_codon:yes gene_type:complete